MPDLGRSDVPAEAIIGIPGNSCCLVIAVHLFPDMKQDPVIVAEVRHDNVPLLWGTDNPRDRLTATTAGKDRRTLESVLFQTPAAAFLVDAAAAGRISSS